MRLTLWSSKDLSALVASLGPARDYAVLAKKIRKSGLDGLSLRDAYGIAALDVLLYELGWQQPEDVHPLLRHKLHGVLGECVSCYILNLNVKHVCTKQSRHGFNILPSKTFCVWAFISLKASCVTTARYQLPCKCVCVF